MGVCAGQEGAGGRLSPCAPGPPATVSTAAAALRARSPLRTPSLPQFALSRASRLPYSRPVPLALSPLSLFPPSLSHKQDGGCCFLLLPNPPYRIAVAAAAGNEPRWGRGGGAKRGGAGPRAGRGGGGASPLPLTQWGKSRAGGGANSHHGIRPRAQRGRRFRKLPPGVTRWLPLKGRFRRRGVQGVDLERIFSRWTFAGEGAWAGSLRSRSSGAAP